MKSRILSITKDVQVVCPECDGWSCSYCNKTGLIKTDIITTEYKKVIKKEKSK